MEKNEMLNKQTQIEQKYEELEKAFFEFISLIDIDQYCLEEAEESEDKFEALLRLDPDCIFFDDGRESREYDNFAHKHWLLQQQWLMLDEVLKSGDDKKAAHRNKKQVEMLIRRIRELKHESQKVIEKEQQVINMADDGLKLLDELSAAL